MSTSSNIRYNHSGNIEDEDGGSYFVVDEHGTDVLGPFASGSYAVTCMNRSKWPHDLTIEYRAD